MRSMVAWGCALVLAACSGDAVDDVQVSDSGSDVAVAADTPAPEDVADTPAPEDVADAAIEDSADTTAVADTSGCAPIGDDSDASGPPVPCYATCALEDDLPRECVNGKWICPAASVEPADCAKECAGTSESSLAGATIVVNATDCTFTQAEAAAGVAIAYSVAIAEDIPDVIAKPGDAGACAQPGPSGLYVFERLAGGDQSYCICDQGLCMPPEPKAVTLKKGSHAATFQWDGVNWYGPSDTGNPKGPPFPPGTYTLTLRSTGSTDVPGGPIPFEVKATATVTITP